MYAYTYDKETGGLLLTDTLTSSSKEPRPVYSRELDILGFQEYWTYEQQDEAPYLWAEANFYWYRGQRVAHTTGGSLYEKPAICLEKNEQGKDFLPSGTALKAVDIPRMVEKNRGMVAVIEKTTTKKIYDVYQRYKNKLDCFHVAFSGGKDSIVLLELVKRALPRSSFLVVFGDTGMEFPDTYDVVMIIDQGAEVRHCAFIRGSAVVGKGAVVGNSTELKNAVLFDGVQVPHYNYVGDSILGYKAHFGAGVITSNVKGDKSPVVVKAAGALYPTNRKKVGALAGDFAEVGCNTVLNPGTIIGRRGRIYPLCSVRGFVPENHLLKNDGTCSLQE